MSTKAPKKRRRPRTACSACHRRKERCDQHLPCSNCIARAAESDCHYDHLTENDERKSQLHKVATLREDKSTPKYETISSQREVPRSSSEDSEVSGSTPCIDKAFSSFYGENAFLHLKELLEDNLPNDGIDLDANLDRIRPHANEVAIWRIVDLLPEPSLLESLIDHYFKAIVPLVILIQRCYFDKMYAKWLLVRVEHPRPSINSLSKDLQHFPGMLFQLAGLSLQYLTKQDKLWNRMHLASPDECMELSQRYSDLSAKMTHLLGNHSACIVSIQQALLRCSWLKNNGDGVDAWHVFGEATRHAQYLGLHQQPARDLTVPRDFWADQYRRILWVYLMVWDSGLSAHLGRPRFLNLSDCDVSEPLDVPFPMNPETSRIPTRTYHEPSTTSLFLALYAIYREVDLLKLESVECRQGQKYQDLVAKYEGRLQAVLTRISPYLQPDNPDRSLDWKHTYLPTYRLVVQNIVHVVVMNLHQKHIRDDKSSRTAALHASLCSIEIMKKLHTVSSSLYHRTFATAFYTISAATLIAATVVLAPEETLHLRRQIEASLASAQARLSIITPTKKSASTGVMIVKMCFERVQRAYLLNDATESMHCVKADTKSPAVSAAYEMSPELEDFAWSLHNSSSAQP